jgi:hypothetical protein
VVAIVGMRTNVHVQVCANEREIEPILITVADRERLERRKRPVNRAWCAARELR